MHSKIKLIAIVVFMVMPLSTLILEYWRLYMTTKCDYCIYKEEDKHILSGDDGVYEGHDGKFYLRAEHFRGETVIIRVKYCPQCGRKLGD